MIYDLLLWMRKVTDHLPTPLTRPPYLKIPPTKWGLGLPMEHQIQRLRHAVDLQTVFSTGYGALMDHFFNYCRRFAMSIGGASQRPAGRIHSFLFDCVNGGAHL